MDLRLRKSAQNEIKGNTSIAQTTSKRASGKRRTAGISQGVREGIGCNIAMIVKRLWKRHSRLPFLASSGESHALRTRSRCRSVTAGHRGAKFGEFLFDLRCTGVMRRNPAVFRREAVGQRHV